ncbi:MAG: hypothetical protein GY775_19015 [Candidatus Scalindua sp.]|nr:hypothetical protein [Candidatus Scalindua sp.]
MIHFLKKRPGIATLLLSIISLLLSLLVGEIFFRLNGNVRTLPKQPLTTERPEMYQEYKPYGYRLWPSRTMSYLYPHNNPRKLQVISNSDGFRSQREIDEPDERTRIVVVGDSFVFGEGVEERERFTNTLETMHHEWRVDSLGMPGYGPGLMIRALENVGLDIHPDVVVFSMYTQDFPRVHPFYSGAGFEIPRFTLESGLLVTVPYPKYHFWDHSRLYHKVRRVIWERTNSEYDLNEAILNRFAKLSKHNNFVPVIIFLPAKGDGHIDKQRRNWLLEYSIRNKISYLDLTEQILVAGSEKYFIKQNDHYNPKGHRVVAYALSNFLSKVVIKNQ